MTVESNDFQQNLRLLCSFFPSVAEVCRRLQINRAQFNKYLNGRTRPSPYILKRLCDFFGVEEYEILLPPGEFAQILSQGPPQTATDPPAGSILMDHLQPLAAETQGRLDKYCGRYHEYYFSMSAPGMVMKSFIHFNKRGQNYFYERIERLTPIGAPKTRRTAHCRYLGTALQLQDRIFLQDYESLTRNEICATILFPCFQEKVHQLTGLRLGVAARTQRTPACSRVLWETVPAGLSNRRALAACGLLSPGDDALSLDRLHLIKNEMADGDAFFTIV